MRGLGGLRSAAPRRALLIAAYLLAGIALGAFLSLVLHLARGAPPPAVAATRVVSAEPLARQTAPDFTLTDQDGRTVSLSSLRGHVVLLTFLDPQCTKLCPVIGKDIGALERRLPASLQPQLLIVSVAAGRTKADVQAFLHRELPGWTGSWHWLLGPNHAALQLAWLRWHITVLPTAGDIAHDAVLEVIDPSGHLRASYPAPLPITDVAHAIRTIAHD